MDVAQRVGQLVSELEGYKSSLNAQGVEMQSRLGKITKKESELAVFAESLKAREDIVKGVESYVIAKKEAEKARKDAVVALTELEKEEESFRQMKSAYLNQVSIDKQQISCDREMVKREWDLIKTERKRIADEAEKETYKKRVIDEIAKKVMD